MKWNVFPMCQQLLCAFSLHVPQTRSTVCESRHVTALMLHLQFFILITAVLRSQRKSAITNNKPTYKQYWGQKFTARHL